ncbi:hypothetical protein NQ315_003620 [Exocentrus adspersus]|uniref:Transposase Helix-turn-helix domain-containing protein n=1 Tax=Exocentrus adspersus TaxID=1586481 RepID=A0AAV8VJS4_9CUCU|nr:hypothetical protein NQ315_003620 [Exocentrus adspersus]
MFSENVDVDTDDLLLLLMMMMMMMHTAAASIALLTANTRKRRRWWVRPIYQKRMQQGDYHNLMREMRLSDCEMFFHYTRLTVEQFDDLLRTVGPHITKKSNRAPLGPVQRLAITLRFLATGCSHQTLAFQFRIGKESYSM